jgi:hypothetical protein
MKDEVSMVLADACTLKTITIHSQVFECLKSNVFTQAEYES